MNEVIDSTTVQRFIQQVASTSPMPASGSAAAVAGALAIGLAEKAINISLASGSLKKDEREVFERTARQWHAVRIELLERAQEDVTSYREYLKIKRLQTDDAISARDELDHAIAATIAVPRRILQILADALPYMSGLADRCKPILASEIHAAATLAYAASEVLCAVLEQNYSAHPHHAESHEAGRWLETTRANVEESHRDVIGELRWSNADK